MWHAIWLLPVVWLPPQSEWNKPITPVQTSEALTPTEEIEIHRFVFTEQLQTNPHVTFLAVGFENREWIAPPDSLMTELKHTYGHLKSNEHIRMPHRGEMTAIGRYRGLEDVQTGQPCELLFISYIKRVNKTTYEVSHGIYGGPLNASGVTWVLQRTKNGWKILEQKKRWTS